MLSFKRGIDVYDQWTLKQGQIWCYQMPRFILPPFTQRHTARKTDKLQLHHYLMERKKNWYPDLSLYYLGNRFRKYMFLKLLDGLLHSCSWGKTLKMSPIPKVLQNCPCSTVHSSTPNRLGCLRPALDASPIDPSKIEILTLETGGRGHWNHLRESSSPGTWNDHQSFAGAAKFLEVELVWLLRYVDRLGQAS